MTRHPAQSKCDLLIIGAGPAGMSAAIVARRAGLEVIVADEGEAPEDRSIATHRGLRSRMHPCSATNIARDAR
ncbi:putative succinate dehydrogenase [Caballeronia telluris]|uniref:Succinate dehydrogenase n=1 Tax=Caballeronia telluris TaxID=326475 RepID=A0A158K983_9BURK|nr:putative succinate dehydrogenase [Caballeronia telluris]